MRFLSYLLTFLTAVLLAACGGGGGSPGLIGGPGSAFTVAAPTALTLQVGLIQNYAISGGLKPYSVVSSDPAVAVGWLISDNVLAVGTVVGGKAIITAMDAQGTKFSITVTAGSSTAFFTTAPTALKIAPGEMTATTYRLGGGTAPYTAVSSNPSFVSAVVNGNDVTIKALRLDVSGDTPVTITMKDSSSPKQELTTSVTVGAVKLLVTPNKFQVYLGDKVTALITGGTPPYRALVPIDEALVAARIVNGNQVEVIGGRIADPAGVLVIDSNNQSANIDVTVINGQDILRISPNLLSIPENPNTPNITLNIYGASQSGSVQAFTDDPTVLIPGTPVKNADGASYTLILSGGNTCSAPKAVPGVDNTVPPDGDFTDLVVGPGQPSPDVPPGITAGGDRTVNITVVDSKGRIGTSAIKVLDTDKKDGCTP